MLQSWDDVERRVRPPEKPYDFSRSHPLQQEQSKLSLAEVYEQEYIKHTQVSGGGGVEGWRDGGVGGWRGGGVEEVVYLLMVHLCMCRQWRRTRKTRGTLRLRN